MPEKLVRDQPGARIQAEGGQIRVALPHEMPVLLARKLVEEAQEVLAEIERAAKGTSVSEHISYWSNMIEELGDVETVLVHLRRVTRISHVSVRDRQVQKNNEAGGFDKRLVWIKDA